MTILDWLIVFGLIGVVLIFGLVRSRQTKSDVDWFLASRNLPFWVVGLSMFAANVDSGDFVSVSGMTYSNGLSVFTVWWLGIPVAYVLAAFVVVPPMYRAGLFTNAEYLENRFGPATRVTSALVQIQYRTNILANVTISLQLLLSLVVGLNASSAWLLVVGLALAATLYSAWGGLKVVAWADVLLAAAMVASIMLLWVIVWSAVGGWEGAVSKLKLEGGEELPAQLLHIGVPRAGEPHPLIVVAAWVIIASGYAVVNHTQVMKLFGARSLWDLKMSVVVGAGAAMVMMYFCGSLGILGRAIWPELLSRPDQVFPLLVGEFLGAGLKGIVLGGVLAAAFSTYQGIASGLSAVFTRDVYARLFAPDRKDPHYLTVCRLVMPLMVVASFVYIPFILRFETMLSFYVRITSVLVTPLLTVYLMGLLRVIHRKSGLAGLIAGSVYGIVAVVTSSQRILPQWLVNEWASYLWSIGFTAAVMLLVSFVQGWGCEEKRRSSERAGWLRSSRHDIPQVVYSPFPGVKVPVWGLPALWAALLIGTAAFLVFYVFW